MIDCSSGSPDFYASARNRDFYTQFGVGEDRLFSMPYAVDNAFFQSLCAEVRPQRESLRSSLGLLRGRPVILFAAKFTTVKAPEELLSAFAGSTTNSPRTRRHICCSSATALRGALEERARPLGTPCAFWVSQSIRTPGSL